MGDGRCRWEVDHSPVQLSLEILTLLSNPLLSLTHFGPSTHWRFTVLCIKSVKETDNIILLNILEVVFQAFHYSLKGFTLIYW